MGLLGMLFGKKGPEFTERIWLTTGAKLNDLVGRVRAGQERGANPLVVSHFGATHTALLEALGKTGVTVYNITSSALFPVNLSEVLRQRRAALVLSSAAIPALVTRAVSAQPKDSTLAPVSVLLAEHYPLPERDLQVLALDKVWPMRLEFACYTGLDEPWLASFGTDRIRDMLPKLGIDKEEMLEHPWLNQSIRSAQKRLAQQIRREQACDSCEEWVRRNLREPG